MVSLTEELLIATNLTCFIIALLLSIYISYIESYDITFLWFISQLCGNQIIEKDTLRNHSVELQQQRPTTFINLVIIFSIVAVLFVLGLAIYFNKEYMLIYILLTCIILLNIMYNVPNYKKEFKDYQITWDNLISDLYNKFNVKINGAFFLQKGFGDSLPSEFVKVFVEKYSYVFKNDYNYTNTQTLEQINNTLLNKNNSGEYVSVKLDGVKTLLQLCRPEKCIYKIGNELIEKKDLDIIQEAYYNWLKTVGGDTGKQQFISLPELSEFDKFNKINSQLNTLKYVSWILLFIIMYMLLRTYITINITKELFGFAIITLLILWAMITYYYIKMKQHVF
jgi:hypothetical protein